MRSVAIILALVALLVAPLGAVAAEPRFEMADIESELMCPTCQSRLDMSNSPAAERIRAFVDEKRQAGWTEQEVKDALVADFGPAVLAAPPAAGMGLVAWLVPILAVGGGALVVAGLVVLWRRRRADDAGVGAPVAVASSDAAMDERIDAALRALDD